MFCSPILLCVFFDLCYEYSPQFWHLNFLGWFTIMSHPIKVNIFSAVMLVRLPGSIIIISYFQISTTQTQFSLVTWDHSRWAFQVFFFLLSITCFLLFIFALNNLAMSIFSLGVPSSNFLYFGIDISSLVNILLFWSVFQAHVKEVFN